MAGFDTSNPGDSDIVSQYPTNERAQRSAHSSAFNLEHDSAGAGRHKLPTGNTSARDALTGFNDGTLFINTSAGTGNMFIEVWSSATSAWEGTAGSATVLATATSAEMVAGTVSANRNMSPYLVLAAISANSLTSAGYKVGTFTRDLSSGTGTQAITGVGFTPSAIFLLGADNGGAANEMSMGFDDGSVAGCLSQRSATGDNTWGALEKVASFVTAGATISQATVTTLGSDGFTLTWTESGSPTGTMTIKYLAIGHA